MNSSALVANETGNLTESGSDVIDWRNVLIGAIMYAVAFVTFFGNLMVLLAVYIDKSLRTAFNFLIVNLAIADMAVSVTAMTFYTTDKMLGYWPFGSIMCTVWIFCDYGLTFASVFTLVAISADRFWSVFWSLNYRSTNKKKKSLTMIATIWLLMLCLWVPALTVDRMKEYHLAGTCMWDPAENRQFVVVIAILGHHGPCITMLVFYFSVFGYLKTRSRVIPLTTPFQETTSGAKDKPPFLLDANTLRNERIESSTVQDVVDISGQSNGELIASQSDVHTTTTTTVSQGHDLDRSTPNSTVTTQITYISTAQVPEDNVRVVQKAQFLPFDNRASKKQNAPRPLESNRASRERRVFMTLTYIIIAYLVCWVPFHFVFDITSLDPEAVPSVVYDFAFWMTYVNSTINPFLYNFGNSEFKQAFKKIVSRQKRRTDRSSNFPNTTSSIQN
ncbi:muscarinic acetylcholine receptor gar-3 [Biomphalaria glabrata]|nr:muscarinic acetylcholine receptor gar-3 [Biomphalaria glabrata]